MRSMFPSGGSGAPPRSRRNSNASSCTVASQLRQQSSFVDDDDEFSMSFRHEHNDAAPSPMLSYLPASGTAHAYNSRPATSQSRLGSVAVAAAHRSSSASPCCGETPGRSAALRGDSAAAGTPAARRTPLSAFITTTTAMQRSRPSSSTSMLNDVLSHSPIHTGALSASLEAASSSPLQRRSSSMRRSNSSPKLRPSRLPAGNNSGIATTEVVVNLEKTKSVVMTPTTANSASTTTASRRQYGPGQRSRRASSSLSSSGDDDDADEEMAGGQHLHVQDSDDPEAVARKTVVYQTGIATALRHVQDRTDALLKQTRPANSSSYGSPRVDRDHSTDHHHSRSVASPAAGGMGRLPGGGTRRRVGPSAMNEGDVFHGGGGGKKAAVGAVDRPGASSWSDATPEAALDGALHAVLGSKFQPIHVQCPDIASAMHSYSSAGNDKGAADVVGAAGAANAGTVAPSALASPPRPASSPTPLGQLQVSKALHFITAQVAVKTSIARRDRKNCFGAAMQTLRENKALHDRLKAQIAVREETAEAERLAAGGGHGDEVSFVRGNCKNAAAPWRFKEDARRHRKEAAERGTLARYMHHQLMEEFASKAEAELVVVRGAERSRDRQWMILLSFIFSTRAVWACFDQGQQQQAAQENVDASEFGNDEGGSESKATKKHSSSGDKIATAHRRASFCTDPLAKNLDKKRQAAAAALRRVLDPNEADMLSPLVTALKSTCLCACMVYKAYRRKVNAVRRIRATLVAAAKVLHTRRNIASLLRNVRTIQRAFRRHLRALAVRRRLTVAQLELYCAERTFFNRTVCQETKDFEKRKAQSRAKDRTKQRLTQQQPPMATTASTAAMSKKRSSVGSGVVPSSTASNVGGSASQQQPRRSSTAVGAASGGPELSRTLSSSQGSMVRPTSSQVVSTGQEGSHARFPNKTASTTMTNHSTTFGRRLDDALGQSNQRSATTDAVDAPSSAGGGAQAATVFQQQLLTAVAVAKPWMPFVAHRNGRRYGNDPATARIVALETHPLYPTSGAKLSHRTQDRLLQFVWAREAAAYAQKKQQWKEKWSDAHHQVAWLKELVVVQCKMKVSPAEQELKSFRWPAVPVRRCLLTSNEMRLLVLLGFTLASEEKQNHRERPSSGGGIGGEASGGSPTDRGGGGGDKDEEDDDDDDDDDEALLDDGPPHHVSLPVVAEGAASGAAAKGNKETTGTTRRANSFGRNSAHHRQLSREACAHMADVLGHLQAQLRLPDVSAEFVAPLLLPAQTTASVVTTSSGAGCGSVGGCTTGDASQT